MRQASLRLLPFLFLLYILCYLDRSNVSIAALQMNKELKFSSATFGFGAGIFFLGYALFEVPSNLILARVGARRWLTRIAITWGLLACAMIFVRTPAQFYTVRFLLGVAEAGFFPGVLYYLSQWFPMAYRARAISAIVIGIPLSGALGGPLGGVLLGLRGVGHLSGWQWLFLIEGLPPVLLGIAALGYLTERPEDARWLSGEQQRWLSHRLEQERQQAGVDKHFPASRPGQPPGVGPHRSVFRPVCSVPGLYPLGADSYPRRARHQRCRHRAYRRRHFSAFGTRLSSRRIAVGPLGRALRSRRTRTGP